MTREEMYDEAFRLLSRAQELLLELRGKHEQAQARAGLLDDGFGSVWHKCQPFRECEMHIVRPGIAVCYKCDEAAMRDADHVPGSPNE